MNFDQKRLEIVLTGEDEDRISINGDLYTLEPLYPGAETGKGGNSCVFAARPDLPELAGYVVKFCRFPVEPVDANFDVRIRRFKQEIRALAKASKSDFSDCFIRIVGAGEVTMDAFENSKPVGAVKLIYYVMEQAERDLERLLSEGDPDLGKRIDLMERLLHCVKAMHSLGYRHRDLKPDNVFEVDGVLKIGDLGLIDRTHQSYGLDSTHEKIGPSGYLSPEAINKAFGDHERITDESRREITEESDIYQLGLIYFYILQGEIPVGRLDASDLESVGERGKEWQDSLFFPMTAFRKANRPNADMVGDLLRKLR